MPVFVRSRVASNFVDDSFVQCRIQHEPCARSCGVASVRHLSGVDNGNHRSSGTSFVSAKQVIECGTSGGPVVTEDGELFGEFQTRFYADAVFKSFGVE